MPPDEPNQSPDYALARALIDALLTPLTPEELEEGRRDMEANAQVVERQGVHLFVQPNIEIDPRVGRNPVRPPHSAPTGGDVVARPAARRVPNETPPDEDDDEDRCEECGELGTENGYLCYTCLAELSNEDWLTCPFCQQSSSEECEHLVLGQDSTSTWVFAPMSEEDLPYLDDGDASPDAWGAGEVEEVFGDLGPLVRAYETPCTEPHMVDFYERLAALLTTPVVVRTGIDAMAVYSEQDRDTARAEVETILGGLAEGFARLAVARRASPDPEGARR